MPPILPNFKRLLIPGKTDPKAHPGYATDMRTIERYINAIKAAASAGYASLTGPGQTVSPGTLTQNGGFIISDNTGQGVIVSENGGGVNISENGGGGYVLSDNGGGMIIRELNGGNMIISDTDTTGLGLVIRQLGGAASGGIDIHANGTNQVNLGHAADVVSFFGMAGGSTKRTITGSRGGNAALASLLTALDAYGLIINSTTP